MSSLSPLDEFKKMLNRQLHYSRKYKTGVEELEMKCLLMPVP
jgi:hypothetical protein